MSYAASSNSIKNQNRYSMQPKATGRSQLSLNIRKLVDVMDIDLLAASLGIRESVLRDILAGKESGDTYRQFLEQKLDEAGFASHWLDRVNAPLFPDQIKELKLLASASNQKAPLRRNNLKTLMLAFDGKLDILADALDVVPASLLKVAEGELILDDQRFGHFNPRLVEAGFPDSWLDHAQAKVEDEWAQGLIRMAADQYESYLSSVEEKQSTPPSLAVSSTPLVTNKMTMETSPAPSAAKVDTASLVANVPPPLVTKSKNSLINAIFAPKKTKVVTEQKQETAQASEQLPAKAPVTAPVAVPAAVVKPTSATALKGIAPPPPKKAAAVAPEVPSQLKPSVFTKAGTAMSPAALLQEEAQRKAVEQAKAEPKVIKADNVSSLRASRFEALMDKAYRGLRTYIWHELLKKKLAHFYSIKEGVNQFTDEQANAITQALGLPQGWLDDSQGDLMIALPWVYDKTLPMILGTAEKKDAAPATTTTRVVSPATLLQSISKLKPAKAEKAEKAPKADKAPAAAEKAKPVAEEEVTAPALKEVAAPVAVVPVEVAVPVATPVAQVASVPAAPATPSTPAIFAAASQAKGNLGILVTALLNTIELHALQGKFSEQDALDLIYKLQTK